MNLPFFNHNFQTYEFNYHLRLRLFFDGLIVGIIDGLIISLFRFLLQYGEEYRNQIYTTLSNLLNNDFQNFCLGLILLLICLILIVLILHYLIRFEPMASGSGIPQVKGVLLNLIDSNWLRIILVKIFGGVTAISAGLSLGREGPSIQLGAMASQGYSRILNRSKIEEKYLLTSGASAGLASAFNAPLAGVIFALEELHHNFSTVVLLPSMSAALMATFISRILFGNESIFIFNKFKLLPFSAIWLVLLVAVLAGIAGIIFNKGLIYTNKFYSSKYFPNIPNKIFFALVISVLLGFTLPQVLGGGNQLVNYLAKTPVTLQFLCSLLITKFLFTLISYGAGCPGGFFLPMLVIGALIGEVCAKILVIFHYISTDYTVNILVIAMTSFFSASVKAPITGIVLIMEMSKSHSILLSCAISAMVGFTISEILKSKPIYETLLNETLRQQKHPKILTDNDLITQNKHLQNQDQFYSKY